MTDGIDIRKPEGGWTCSQVFFALIGLLIVGGAVLEWLFL